MWGFNTDVAAGVVARAPHFELHRGDPLLYFSHDFPQAGLPKPTMKRNQGDYPLLGGQNRGIGAGGGQGREIRVDAVGPLQGITGQVGTHLAPGSASLGDPDTELPFAEPISEEAREFVQPLIDLFGDNWARCWSSPQWQLLKDQFWLSSSGCARVLKCLKMIFGFI